MSKRHTDRSHHFKNPFSTGGVALGEQFFGREKEIHLLLDFLQHKSSYIDGSTGVGKTSLLNEMRRILFDQSSRKNSCVFYIAEPQKGEQTDFAELFLMLAQNYAKSKSKTTFSVKVFRVEKEVSGDHLIRALAEKVDEIASGDGTRVIFAIDESHLAPEAIGTFVKQLSTALSNLSNDQKRGQDALRFLLVGTTPFFNSVIGLGKGRENFFGPGLTLIPFEVEQATEYVKERLDSVAADQYEPQLPDLVARLSGGLPRLIHLLGFYLINRANERIRSSGEEAPFVINEKDLGGAVAYAHDARRTVYENILQLAKKDEYADDLVNLVMNHADRGCPTFIAGNRVDQLIEGGEIQQDKVEAIERSGLLWRQHDGWRLLDEFLRIHLLRTNKMNSRSVEDALFKDLTYPKLPRDSND